MIEIYNIGIYIWNFILNKTNINLMSSYVLFKSLSEDLVVDGDTYGCIKSFCYLGDTLDEDGGADLAVTARIRNRLMKFREVLLFLIS